jgi:poly-gamma-glutamate synthesis protein (capsule biosynthesis protein)
MAILFCGDVMPGGVLPYQKEYISKDVLKYMQSFDLRIGTLEAAIGTDLEYDQVKMKGRQNIVYARNEDFFRVVEMGFNVVSLANNHVFDLGVEGLRNTIKILDENGIKHCGAGENIEEASKPAIIEYKGKTIAILAYCMYGNAYLGYVELADNNKPGINPLDIDKVVLDIQKYKKQYDYVIVMPHWGREYQYFPMVECKKMAYQMIDAGADAIMGSHAHNIQPMIKYKGKSIYFGMGNYLFPDFYMYPPRPIWYPNENMDLTNIKREIGYPYPINQPIVSVWNGRSRIGIVSRIELENNKLLANYRFVYLSASNIVKFYDCFNRHLKRFRMWWMGSVIKCSNYELCIRCYNSRFNIPRRLLHKVSRILNINYDVKV